jgi:4-nitrophenyl phosphatase
MPAAFPFDRVRHLLIDLDGVLYRGNQSLPSAEEFILRLYQRDITFRLVTNNATLTPEQYRQKLAAMGIEVRASEVFTSALAAAAYLRDEGQTGKQVFVIGQDGLHDALAEVGMQEGGGRPDWVVAGLDRELTYRKLATAALAIEAGARFLGTNPDTSFPTESGLEPGAGAILAALTATTGVTPVVVGKPEPYMFELAMRDLGGTPSDTAVLGDRLDTDIAGAVRAHLPSIMVLTGVSQRADLDSSSVQPDLVIDNLPDLLQRWPE